MRRIFVALVLSGLVVDAQAEEQIGIDFVNGNQLYEFCQRSPDYCLGYVAGVAAGSQIRATFCLGGVTSSQLRDVVNFWLRDHPDKRYLAGSLLVAEALKEKFPCNSEGTNATQRVHR